MTAAKPLESALNQVRDEVLWWRAAIDTCGPIEDFTRPLRQAEERYRALARRARQPERVSGEIPQETIDRIVELVTMPDIIPDVLRHLCGEVLEWRAGGKTGYLQTCPFCSNSRRNFEMVIESGPKCGLWTCRACNEGGSFKWLLMRRSGLPFRELMRELGYYAGVTIEDAKPPRAQKWEPV